MNLHTNFHALALGSQTRKYLLALVILNQVTNIVCNVSKSGSPSYEFDKEGVPCTQISVRANIHIMYIHIYAVSNAGRVYDISFIVIPVATPYSIKTSLFKF